MQCLKSDCMCPDTGFRVVVVDPEPLLKWPNNYGVWVDEFAAMGLDSCLELVWPRATVFLDSSEGGQRSGALQVDMLPDGRICLTAYVDCRFLSRPYGRVDRPKLKRMLLERCIANGKPQ